MILENKIKSFEIFSLPEAIFFHKKYKFDPNISNETTMKFFLADTIDNCQKKKNYPHLSIKLTSHYLVYHSFLNFSMFL